MRTRLAAIAATVSFTLAVVLLAGWSLDLGDGEASPSASREEGRQEASSRPQDEPTGSTDRGRQACPPTRRPSDASWAPDSRVLSNGCALSRRGLPTCGTLFGSSLTNNGDPTSWETSMGDHLGVRRTYYQSWQVDKAVKTAEADAAVGRVPWISFKTPYTWAEMVAGKGDAWARDLALRMSRVEGPVWLAVHHEPENDGDITQWTQMQERIAPIVRRTAPNVAYSIIVTGWNSLHGPDPAHRLDSLYPDTAIDLVGLDIYNKYGNKDGVTTQTDMKAQFFDKIARWAEDRDVAWGLAETGYNDLAARDWPEWLSVTYDQMAETGGVAMTYWNSTQDTQSGGDYSLAGQKASTFADVLLRSPKLKSRARLSTPCTASDAPDEGG